MSDATGRVDTDRPPSLWRNTDFVRYLSGTFVTNLGDSLYTVAVVWLVFQLSGSTALTGVAQALLLLPWLLQAAAGPVVDRVSIRRLLVGTQLAQGVVVLAFPLAAATGHLSVALALAVIPALSLLALLLSPVRAALVPRIVAEDRLAEGNSALGTVTLGLDTVFEAVGGLLIAAVGTAALFVVDAATFLVAAVLYAGMSVPPAGDGDDAAGPADDGGLAGYVDDLGAGVRSLRGTVFVEMVFTSAVFHLAVGAMLAVLPAFGAARGGAATYGLLLGAFGVGRMAGTASAARLEGLPYGRWKAVTYVAAAGLWVGSVLAPSRALTVVLFGLAWVPAGVNGVLVSTLNQRVFPEAMLGRVSAIKGTASTATLPVGALVGGVAGTVLGATATMGLAAGGFLFVGLYFAARAPLRRLPSVRDVDPARFDVHPGQGED
jgi:hypothetical protein